MTALLLALLALPAADASTTTPAQPNDEGELVFHDDFERGADRWERLDPGTFDVADRGGSRVLEITRRQSAYKPPHRSPGHVALIRDLKAGDLEITLRVRSTKDTGGHRDCCVFFGWQDAGHFYYVHLGARPDPHSGQIMIVNGADRRALTDNKRPVPWDDQWHTVQLRRTVATGEIAVYFDDLERPIMTAVDKTFGAGRIGIGSFDDLNAFDDVVILGLQD